jgi:formylglycine-generating enzyme required for sulfatase activity
MSVGMRIVDSLGERRVEQQDFPLALGGPGCAVVVAATGGPIAWLGLHEDALFLQSEDSGQLLHNGLPVQGSVWLHVGDVVTSGNVTLRIRNVEGTRTLVVEDGGAGNTTAPPAAERGGVVAGSSVSGYETIASTAYRANQATAHQKQKRSPVPLLVGAAALSVMLILWFLATGVAVRIQVRPANATLTVSGTWLAPRFGEQLFVRPGRYTLSAQAKGYRTQSVGFTVSGQPGQLVALELTKLPGELVVELPAAGSMSVDGNATFKVPGHVSLPAGKHNVTIEVPGYLPFRTTVAVAGAGSSQQLAPKLVANSAPLSVNSQPAGAQVFIDGKPVGVTPLAQVLGAATHHVELRLAGFKPWSVDVLVKPNEPQNIGPVRLGLPDASLLVRSSPAGAGVTVGGVYRGNTPLRLVLRPEVETTVIVSQPGYQEASRPLRPRPGASEELNVELAPILGKISIRVTPPDAEVWVDGASRGRGSQSLSLTTVAHQIEVRKAGYVSFSAAVTPRPGFDQAVEASLLTEAQQHMARIPTVVRAHASIELRLMPTGGYTMGSSRREPGRRANEGQRPVELRRPFYLGVREISNADFHAFRAEHKSGIFAGVSLNLDNQPVVAVSWQDAAEYCNWLSQRDGLPMAYRPEGGALVPVTPMNTGYRLPTEAEWEWVARGTVAAHRYPWGNALPIPANSGNYADVSARTPLPDAITDYDDGFLAAAPVGSFAASSLGLYDLGGNVSEWTTDFYATSYDAAAVAVDPINPAAGNQHAVRGASWRSASSADLRVAARAAGSVPRDDLGFRIARYAE